MRAARRVPWSSKSELAELYEMLFSPSSNEASRKRGLSRMNVYISSPSCPAFMFLLHSLLSAALLSSPRKSEETSIARLACAMAIVRFINGLVDPLQTGPYARPISHIAASLHIPPQIIAFRHRATHEDLPPLHILQQAVRECIDYLHHYSFLPLLAESSMSAEAEAYGAQETGRGVEVAKTWKKVMKQRIRDKDVREDSFTGKEMTRVKRDVERMIRRGEIGEIVFVLCGVEGLVPMAKSKRSKLVDTTPPESSMRIWQPLLDYVSSLESPFPAMLANEVVNILLVPTPSSSSENSEMDISGTDLPKEMLSSSFRWTLATWVCWLWQENHINQEDKRGLWKRLMSGMMNGNYLVQNLCKTLSECDDTLKESYETFIGMVAAQDGPVADVRLDIQNGSSLQEETNLSSDRVDSELQKMEDRVLILQDAMASKQIASSPLDNRAPHTQDRSYQPEINVAVDSMASESSIPGWRRLTPQEWTPRPIGVYAL